MESPRSERIRRLKHLEQNSDLIIEVDLLNKCTFDNLFIMTEQEILERKKNELTIKKITKPRVKKESTNNNFYKKIKNLDIPEEIKNTACEKAEEIFSRGLYNGGRKKRSGQMQFLILYKTCEDLATKNSQSGISSYYNRMLIDKDDLRKKCGITKSDASKAKSVYSNFEITYHNSENPERAFDDMLSIYCNKLMIEADIYIRMADFCKQMFQEKPSFTNEIPHTLCAGIVFYYCTKIDTDIIQNEKSNIFLIRLAEIIGRSPMTIKNKAKEIEACHTIVKKKKQDQMLNMMTNKENYN